MVDSTELKVAGEKEWMSYKHGTKQRKVWRKLHLSIDEKGEILSSELTYHTESETGQVAGLLAGIGSPIDTLIREGAYDNAFIYKALDKHEQRYPPRAPLFEPLFLPIRAFKKQEKQKLHSISGIFV